MSARSSPFIICKNFYRGCFGSGFSRASSPALRGAKWQIQSGPYIDNLILETGDYVFEGVPAGLLRGAEQGTHSLYGLKSDAEHDALTFTALRAQDHHEKVLQKV